MSKLLNHRILNKNGGSIFDAESEKPITVVLNHNFAIAAIDSLGARLLFNKPKSRVLNLSFLDLLRTQGIDTNGFEYACNLSKKKTFAFAHLEFNGTRKRYDVAVIAITEGNLIYFAVTLSAIYEAYRTLKSYIDVIINNLPGAVYWKDRESRYMGCNKFVAMMAGLNKPEEIIGKTDYDLCWREFAENWRSHDRKVIKENITLIREEKVKLANGKIITELTYKTPFKDEKGELIGIIGISLDITERKEMEEALHQAKLAAEMASAAKSEFLRNMEHQLRTPFSGIYSLVEILAKDETNPEKKELLEATYHSAKELLDVLNDIIDFVRNRVDSIGVLARKFNLKEIIQKAVTMHEAAAKIKNLNLIVEYEPSLPVLYIGDPNRIHRIVLNLLSNAIRFTAEGQVRVDVRGIKQTEKNIILQIIIADTGIGIPYEKQPFIYERFYRVHPANQNQYLGVGLGLNVVKQLLEDLEGEIDLLSEPGNGTTFICTFPLKRPLINELKEYFEGIPKLGKPTN